MVERTGSHVFLYLWQYVVENSQWVIYIFFLISEIAASTLVSVFYIKFEYMSTETSYTQSQRSVRFLHVYSSYHDSIICPPDVACIYK